MALKWQTTTARDSTKMLNEKKACDPGFDWIIQQVITRFQFA